jgi:hypothetical protein
MPKLEDPGDSEPKDLCFCTTTMMRSPVELSGPGHALKLSSDLTYSRSLLLFSHNSYTFNDSSSRIVDAIKHRLLCYQ